MVAVSVMRVMLCVGDVSMLRECEGDINSDVGTGGGCGECGM